MVNLLLGAATESGRAAGSGSLGVQVVATVIACTLIVYLTWNLICNSDKVPPTDDRDLYDSDHEQWI